MSSTNGPPHPSWRRRSTANLQLLDRSTVVLSPLRRRRSLPAPRHFNWWDVPIEVRIMIYNFAFSDPRLKFTIHGAQAADSAGTFQRLRHQVFIFPKLLLKAPGLLFASRRTYLEARHVISPLLEMLQSSIVLGRFTTAPSNEFLRLCRNSHFVFSCCASVFDAFMNTTPQIILNAVTSIVLTPWIMDRSVDFRGCYVLWHQHHGRQTTFSNQVFRRMPILKNITLPQPLPGTGPCSAESRYSLGAPLAICRMLEGCLTDTVRFYACSLNNSRLTFEDNQELLKILSPTMATLDPTQIHNARPESGRNYDTLTIEILNMASRIVWKREQTFDSHTEREYTYGCSSVQNTLLCKRGRISPNQSSADELLKELFTR